MITAEQIGWGSYSSFEGPYYSGKKKFAIPSSPTENEKRLKVVTSTEGGCFDAVNCYDSCIVSTGLIQLCEARYFLTSKLLHHVAVTLSPSIIISALTPALKATNSVFTKNASGNWRFHTIETDGKFIEVKTLKQQQDLFLGVKKKKKKFFIFFKK